MGLMAGAWRLREAARRAIAAGDPGRARALALRAQEICRTPDGGRLETLSSWLVEICQRRDAVAGQPVKAG
jgi:hypothetical protein